MMWNKKSYTKIISIIESAITLLMCKEQSCLICGIPQTFLQLPYSPLFHKMLMSSNRINLYYIASSGKKCL